MNAKRLHVDLNCRYCSENIPESQDNIQECVGTEFERRGLDLSGDLGMVDFWRRMQKKIATVATGAH